MVLLLWLMPICVFSIDLKDCAYDFVGIRTRQETQDFAGDSSAVKYFLHTKLDVVLARFFFIPELDDEDNEMIDLVLFSNPNISKKAIGACYMLLVPRSDVGDGKYDGWFSIARWKGKRATPQEEWDVWVYYMIWYP